MPIGPSLKVIFVKFSTCRSREQCTGSKEKRKHQSRLLSKLTLTSYKL